MILTNTVIQDSIVKAYCCMAEKSAEYSKHLSYGKNDECLLKEIMLLQRYISILQDFEIIVDPEDQVCLTNDDIIKIIKKINKVCEFCCCSEIEPKLINGVFSTNGNYVVDNTTVTVSNSPPSSCVKPTIQARFIDGVLVYDSITNTYSVTLTWTRGNGNGVLVVGNLFTGSQWPVPITGTTYTTNTVFGSGGIVAPGYFAVYSGTGSSVVVTNLTPVPYNVGNYNFLLYEYNSSGMCYLVPPEALQFVAQPPITP